MNNVTVSDFLENLRGINFKSLTATIIKDNEKQIVDLNRKDQIFTKGIDADGNAISTYSARTQSIYDTYPPRDTMGGFKRRGYSYNLFWSGRSYYNFRAYMEGLKLYITSDSRGRRLLIQNGGDSIFGLTSDNKKKVNWEIIAPKINEEVRKALL